MKKSFRRGAALLLTFMMLLGMVCMPASADTTTATMTTDGYGNPVLDWDFETGQLFDNAYKTSATGKDLKYDMDVVKAPDGLNQNHGYVLRMRTDYEDRGKGATDGFIGTPYSYVNKQNAANKGILTDTEALPYQKIKVSFDVSFTQKMKMLFNLWGNVDATESTNNYSNIGLVNFYADGTYTFAGSGTKNQYEANKWYHIDAYVDVTDGTCKFSVTDGITTVTETTKVSGFAAYRYVMALRICYYSDAGKANDGQAIYMDNLKWLRQVDPVFAGASPENTTAFPVVGGETEFTFTNPMDATQTVGATISAGTETIDAKATVDGNKIIVENTNALPADTDCTFAIPAGTKDINGKTLAQGATVTVHTAAKTDVYSEAVKVETGDSNVSATTKVANFKAGTGSAALIIAKYDANGNLIGHDIDLKTDIAQDGTANLSAELSKPEEGETVYVYAVDGETLSKPLNPTAWKITSAGAEQMLNDYTPTTVTMNPLEISDEGEITVSGSVAPKQKTLVYINVQGPKAPTTGGKGTAAEDTEASALIPVLTSANGEFELTYTPEDFVSGKYTATVGGWQAESQTASAFCIDKDTRDNILSAVNGANDGGAMDTALTDEYRKLLSDDATVFCGNAFQTLVEQKPNGGYTSVSDITKMLNTAKSLLAKVNAASAAELAAVMEADADIILHGVTFLDDFKALSTENKARICGFMSDDTTYTDFAELREELDWAWSHHLDIKNGVNNAQTADDIKTVLEAKQTLIGEDASLFCTNAYQTLLEQKGYKGVADIVAMMKTAKSLLETVNTTNYAKLAPVLTDAENKKILFFGYAALDTFANSEEDIRTTVCSYMVPDMPFDSFTALRDSLTAAMTKYNNEQANIKEELNGNQNGMTSQGSRPSVSGGSKGSVSGVLTVGGATTTPTPSATPTPTPSATVETPFADMKDAAWASEHVASLAEKGIISGDADGNFRPNDAVTREEFVKLLVGALGIEVGDAADSFTDADINAWYAKYLAAAKAAGIITGNEDGTFGVGNEITRQDMAVMAVRAVNAIGKTLPSGGATFTDSDSISSYAAQAVGQMQEAGILNGIGNGTFAPMDSTSRAAAAKVIDSLMNLVIGK